MPIAKHDMQIKRRKTLARIVNALLAAASLIPATPRAQVLWSEDINGPLANVAASPTPLGDLFAPQSVLYAYVSHKYLHGEYVSTPDYFTFTIPSGYQLNSIDLGGAGGLNFGMGSSFAVAASPGSLLPQFGIYSPIQSGSYGMYVDNLRPDRADSTIAYSLYWDISPVPEPSTTLLLCCSVALFIQRRAMTFRTPPRQTLAK